MSRQMKVTVTASYTLGEDIELSDLLASLAPDEWSYFDNEGDMVCVRKTGSVTMKFETGPA